VGSGQVQLSAGEVSILAVFRKYLMTPGRMLCLNNTDLGTMKKSLEKLTAAGLLVPEDFKGSYSLTRSGFQAMNELS
jgi:predicted transcriptional regulator